MPLFRSVRGRGPGKDQERSTRVLNQPCRIHTNTEEESHGEEKGKVEQEEEGFLN
jgi:hypothetical protein